MSRKVIIGTSSFASQNALDLLKSHDIQVVQNPYGRRMTEEEIIVLLEDADGLLAGLEPLNERVLKSARLLKAVARVGIGMDNVDLEAARKLGIHVSNTPDAPTKAVAEMTVAALMSIAHQIIPSNDDIHNSVWKKRMGFSLEGLHVLVIGYGRIGKLTAQKLEQQGCQISVFDPYLSDASEKELNAAVVNADVITLHASGNQEVLTADLFDYIQNGTIILNSARGGLINEDALYDALQSGRVSWFWGDSLWEEPYHGKLIGCKNAILTPHICTYTKSCRESMETEAAKNLLRDL